MRKRIISTYNALKETIEHFNYFHDGFLKSLRIISGNKFIQNPPWEKKKNYDSNDKKLRDTGLMYFEKQGLFLEIHHYNYDWPNIPPNNKIIMYLSGIKDVDPNIVQMIGECIIDCRIENSNPELNISLTFETRTFKDNKPLTFEIKPLEFKKMYIQEKR